MWADAQATDMAFTVELAVVSWLERLAQILDRSRIVARVDEVFHIAGLSVASHDPSKRPLESTFGYALLKAAGCAKATAEPESKNVIALPGTVSLRTVFSFRRGGLERLIVEM